MWKGRTLPIFPYLLIQNPCAELAERQSLHVRYWHVASDVKKVRGAGLSFCLGTEVPRHRIGSVGTYGRTYVRMYDVRRR